MCHGAVHRSSGERRKASAYLRLTARPVRGTVERPKDAERPDGSSTQTFALLRAKVGRSFAWGITASTWKRGRIRATRRPGGRADPPDIDSRSNACARRRQRQGALRARGRARMLPSGHREPDALSACAPQKARCTSYGNGCRGQDSVGHRVLLASPIGATCDKVAIGPYAAPPRARPR